MEDQTGLNDDDIESANGRDEMETIKRDVPTRWNSILVMVKSFLSNKGKCFYPNIPKISYYYCKVNIYKSSYCWYWTPVKFFYLFILL